MALKISPSSKSRKFGRNREDLRNAFWPGSDSLVWSRSTHVGFTTIPRSLPLFMRLIRELCPKGNPASVYCGLWSRVFDEGIVQVKEDDALAYEAGYSGSRAIRTWREHLQSLVDLGFVRTKAQGNRDVAAVLILDPYKVVIDLYTDGKIPEEWWAFFVDHCQQIGAEIPIPSAAARVG